MNRLTRTALLLFAAALVCSCQQGYTDRYPSSYTPRQSYSSNAAGTQSSDGDAKAEADAVVISARAKVRARPSNTAEVILEADKDDGLLVLEKKPVGPWYRVRHAASGKEGWVHGNTIKLTPTAPDSSTELSGDAGATATTTRSRRGGGGSSAGGDTYINSFGEEVPRTRRSASVPAGASARCSDGTYSFSRSRRGTCSHHGGVAEWLY
jgi:Protein of unknown function (DUF3761)/Bacterial SH3 domain